MWPKGLAETGEPAPFYHRREASGPDQKVAGTSRGWRAGEDTLVLSGVMEKENDLGHCSLWLSIQAQNFKKKKQQPKARSESKTKPRSRPIYPNQGQIKIIRDASKL